MKVTRSTATASRASTTWSTTTSSRTWCRRAIRTAERLSTVGERRRRSGRPRPARARSSARRRAGDPRRAVSARRHANQPRHPEPQRPEVQPLPAAIACAAPPSTTSRRNSTSSPPRRPSRSCSTPSTTDISSTITRVRRGNANVRRARAVAPVLDGERDAVAVLGEQHLPPSRARRARGAASDAASRPPRRRPTPRPDGPAGSSPKYARRPGSSSSTRRRARVRRPRARRHSRIGGSLGFEDHVGDAHATLPPARELAERPAAGCSRRSWSCRTPGRSPASSPSPPSAARTWAPGRCSASSRSRVS